MLTRKDRLFFNKTQEDFPLVSRPYACLAERYGCTEKDMIGRLRRLRRRGIVRYAGAIFHNGKLDLKPSLVAMRVPPSKLVRTVRIINAYPHVSHNYLREGDYNVWFTISAASDAKLKLLIGQIKHKTGIADVLDLRTTRMFKSRAVFDW